MNETEFFDETVALLRRIESHLAALRMHQVGTRLQEGKAPRSPPPRYDEVFLEGVRAMDAAERGECGSCGYSPCMCDQP